QGERRKDHPISRFAPGGAAWQGPGLKTGSHGRSSRMSGRLAGKKALITAAAAGIGRATTLAFAAEGAEVVATDVDMDKLAALNGKKGITTRRLDVRDGAAVDALAKELGALDVLFNCAGFVHHGTVLDT